VAVPKRRGALWFTAAVVAASGFAFLFGGPALRLDGELSRYEDPSFSFEYPPQWRVISGYDQCGMHGPAVLAAVGTGDLEQGGSVTPNSVTCTGLIWDVSDAGVVVAYHLGPICCPIPPQPAPSLALGESLVDVDGVQAVLSSTDSGMVWYLFRGGPVYIEARWGPEAAGEAPGQVNALVASWRWLSEPF
jgi:hypothetical protein